MIYNWLNYAFLSIIRPFNLNLINSVVLDIIENSITKLSITGIKIRTFLLSI